MSKKKDLLLWVYEDGESLTVDVDDNIRVEHLLGTLFMIVDEMKRQGVSVNDITELIEEDQEEKIAFN